MTFPRGTQYPQHGAAQQPQVDRFTGQAHLVAQPFALAVFQRRGGAQEEQLHVDEGAAGGQAGLAILGQATVAEVRVAENGVEGRVVEIV